MQITNYSNWREYYQDYCKKVAANDPTDNAITLEYGEELYKTPVVRIGRPNRWVVTKFNNQEYNVFLETLPVKGRLARTLAATFSWKEAAMRFALEMLLTCSGNLKKRGHVVGI